MGYFIGKSFFAEIYGFQVRFSLPGSDNVSRRCSCSGTIGALASVVLLFLNARPVVSDERSEEFRRSVKESLSGPVQANRSDGIKTGIGIEEKMPLDFIFNYYFFLLISATKISNSEE